MMSMVISHRNRNIPAAHLAAMSYQWVRYSMAGFGISVLVRLVITSLRSSVRIFMRESAAHSKLTFPFWMWTLALRYPFFSSRWYFTSGHGIESPLMSICSPGSHAVSALLVIVSLVNELSLVNGGNFSIHFSWVMQPPKKIAAKVMAVRAFEKIISANLKKRRTPY